MLRLGLRLKFDSARSQFSAQACRSRVVRSNSEIDQQVAIRATTYLLQQSFIDCAFEGRPNKVLVDDFEVTPNVEPKNLCFNSIAEVEVY